MNSWDQREGETDDQFAAFSAYRSLPKGGRSLRKAYVSYCDNAGKVTTNKKGVSSSFHNWSRKRDWAQRSKEWDRHCERMVAETKLEQVNEANRIHLETAALLEKKTMMAIRVTKVSSLRPKDIVQWLDLASKFRRLAIGESEASILARIAAMDQIEEAREGFTAEQEEKAQKAAEEFMLTMSRISEDVEDE